MKPRIFYRAGFWRVSPMPKPYYRYHELWMDAHHFANQLNQTDLAKPASQ